MKYHYELTNEHELYLKPTGKNEVIVNITPFLQGRTDVKMFENLSKKINAHLLNNPQTLIAGGHHFEDLLLHKFDDYEVLVDYKQPKKSLSTIDELLRIEGKEFYVIDVAVLLGTHSRSNLPNSTCTLRISMYKVKSKDAAKINVILRKLIIDQILKEV